MSALVELLLSNALAATLLAVLVAAACIVIRRPAVRNALWLVVLVRLFLPPVWSVPVLDAECAAVSNAPADEPPVRSTEYQAATDAVGDVRPMAGPSVETPAASGERVGDAVVAAAPPFNAIDALPEPIAQEALTIAPLPRPAVATLLSDSVHSVLRTPYFVLSLWLTGVFLILILAVVRVMRFQRALRQGAVRAPEEFQEQAGAVARKLALKRAPEVWLVPGRVPPMLWMPGLRRRSACIVLPAALALRLGADERSALLAHELAHLRRGDPWVRWLELLAQALYWWHPLLGWFRRRLRESEESCCDAWVVAALPFRRAYATALVETVAFLDDGPVPQPQPLASGVAPVRQLQRRVGMIMRGTTSGRLTRVGLLAALGFAACALAVGPGLTQAQDRERPPEEKRPPAEKKERPVPPVEKNERPFPPKGDRPGSERPPADRGEIERARDELAKAREEAERAMQRVREAEERLARMQGGRLPPRGGEGGFGRPADRRPEGALFGRGEGGVGRGEGGMPDLARQIQELRTMVEELRRELRGRGPVPGPRDARPPEGGDRRPDDRRPEGGPRPERPAQPRP